MKNIVLALIFLSVPVLMMVQMLQSFHYSMALEEMDSYKALQEDRLQENKRLLAGIALLSSPERVYNISKKELGLSIPEPENILHVRFPEETGAEP